LRSVAPNFAGTSKNNRSARFLKRFQKRYVFLQEFLPIQSAFDFSPLDQGRPASICRSAADIRDSE
jgi:hypothetical protein